MPDRAAMAAIIFMARTSTPWALLPVAEFGCDSVTTCWRRFAEWAAAGVFERLQELLLDEFGQAGQLDWSRVSVDSVSLRAVRDVLPADPHRVAVQVVLDDGLTSRRLGNPRPHYRQQPGDLRRVDPGGRVAVAPPQGVTNHPEGGVALPGVPAIGPQPSSTFHVLGMPTSRSSAVPCARPRRVQPLRLSRYWRRSWAASSTSLWRHSAARYWQAIKPMRWRRRKSP